MIDVQEEKNVYLSTFARFEKEAAGRPEWLRHLSKEAFKRFTALGFPTTRDEDWKFTSVSSLVKMPFRPARPDNHRFLLAARLLESLGMPASDDGMRLIFVNGQYAPELSNHVRLPDGVQLGSLAAALERQPERVEPHLARYAHFQTHAFTALNTAFLRDGAYLSFPRGAVLEGPVYLVFLTTEAAAGCAIQPRNLLVLGPSSQARLVEVYIGPEGQPYFSNAVTEVVAGENAVLDHYKLQRDSRAAFHIANLQVHQERSSRFTSHYIGFGGALVRNESRVYLAGEGCEAVVNGLYLASGSQHMDNHTVLDHAMPHCTSHELYKGILDGNAHGVFNGKIVVHQDAQKTDAKQTNQTLLLSEDAVINTKPQLEIFADDVKCTHGATVGQLDADGIFYLRSRGIGLAEARSLLTFAFANDIVRRIQIEPLRRQLEETLLASQHLPRSAGAVEE
jgi:Fe-S cluster assembly protein SufD